MVVIAAIREEGGAFVRNQRRHVETCCLDVEIARQSRVADPHVDMTDAETNRRCVGQLAVARQADTRSSTLSSSVPILTWPSVFHVQPSCGPVGIDLDAVAFRIIQIERFRNRVVGKTGEGDTVDIGGDQPAAQFLAVGHQEGRVVETGRDGSSGASSPAC